MAKKMINLQFTSKRHKHHFNVEKEYINANNKKLLAAIYLLTADKNVSQMLGHTDAGFTMNTYMHVTESMQQKAAEAMSEVIKNSNKPSGKVIKIGA